MSDELPPLRTLRNPRHPGISDAVCENYSEAAEVCLARHHQPPRTEFSIKCGGQTAKRVLGWQFPDDTAQRAWKNADDATRDGAYIVSIAAAERELGLVALSRAETRTGADYYVGPPNAQDLESAFRLEVSGIDQGSSSIVRRRLREKEEQAQRGHSSLPAYASVVEFQGANVVLQLVEEM